MKRVLITVFASAALVAIGACGAETSKQKPQLTTDRLLMNFGQEFGEAVFVGAQKTEALQIINGGLDDLIIQSIDIEGEAFVKTGPSAGELDAGLVTLPYAIKGKKRIFLDVTFRPPSDKNYEGKLTIKSNGENSAPDGGPPGQLFIDLAGSGVKASPQISVGPSPLDFGAVPSNTDKRAMVAVRNVGGVDMSVVGASITLDAGYEAEGFVQQFADGGPANSVEPLPLLIVQGATYLYRVKFTPTSAATFPAQIQFISDAENGSPRPDLMLPDGGGPKRTSTTVSVTGRGQ
jgi:hypothetical protein